MGIPVLEGRPFDRRRSRSAARACWWSISRSPGAISRRAGARAAASSCSASNQALAEIVGVVGDVRHNGLTSEPAPTVFLLHAQTPGYITNLVVRASGDPVAHADAIRRAIHEVDPDAGGRPASGRSSRTSRGAGATAAAGGAGRVLRRDRRRPRRDRHLRPDRLRRDPAHARDRHSPGARRHARGRVFMELFRQGALLVSPVCVGIVAAVARSRESRRRSSSASPPAIRRPTLSPPRRSRASRSPPS